MTCSCLIVATPRAGRWNHRFHVPPEAGLSEQEVAGWADAARTSPCGNDYLAVVRKGAVQTQGGRSGEEFLMLVGLPVARLSGANRQHLEANLHRRLEDLEALIVRRIDWEREGRDMLVCRPELADWYQADVAPLLAQGRRFRLARNRINAVCLVGIVLLLAFLTPQLFDNDIFEHIQQAVSPAKPDPVPPPMDPNKIPVESLTKWAKDLGLETEKPPEASRLLEQVLEKVEGSLFLSRSHPGGNNLVKDAGEPRERLQTLLSILYQAAQAAKAKEDNRFRAEKRDLEELLDDEHLRQLVCELL